MSFGIIGDIESSRLPFAMYMMAHEDRSNGNQNSGTYFAFIYLGNVPSNE
jgi:hypothetical protein